MVCNPQVEEFWKVTKDMDGNTRLVGFFQDKPSTVSMTTRFPVFQENETNHAVNQNYHDTLLLPLFFIRMGIKYSTQLKQPECGICDQCPQRESRSVRVKASCPRCGLPTYLSQAMEELTPSLTSTATQRKISLLLYRAGPSPGCGGINDDSEQPNQL